MNDRVRYILLAVGFIVFVIAGIVSPVENGIRSAVMPVTTAFGGTQFTQQEALDLVRDSKITELETENRTLQNAVKVSAKYDSTVTARVVSHSVHIASNRILVNKGLQDTIKVNQVVLSDGLVVGVVHSATDNQAQIVLLDDQDFRLEVVFGENRGVLKGAVNGSIIDRVLPDVSVEKQQLVMTAGSRTVPANLPVGRVVGQLITSEKVFQQLQFATPVDLDRLSIVQVVR